jgi:hypothetical protein
VPRKVHGLAVADDEVLGGAAVARAMRTVDDGTQKTVMSGQMFTPIPICCIGLCQFQDQ